MTESLVRQRIRYLIEFGGVYPAEEPASKNFVLKVAAAIIAVDVLEDVIGYALQVLLG